MSARRRLASLAAVAFAATSASMILGCSIPSAMTPSFSGSVGAPHAGFLTDGAELPKEGKGFRWKSAADHHFGLPRMVAMIEEAAGSVAEQRPSSQPLFVGDISAKGGGALMPKHRSHRTGRDVDLLLYMTTLEGVPTPGNGFVQMGADGLGVEAGGRFVRFDVDREWLLIRSLVETKKAHVQWIFIARVLQALVIEHALALGEPSELVMMAEQIMHQPGDSLPHDDHIHVRIACEPDELATGCDGSGPRWPWMPKVASYEAPSSELIESLLGPSIAIETPIASNL